MKELKFYKFATILLVVLNLCILAIVLLRNPSTHSKNNSRDFLKHAIRLLHLDEQQEEKFKHLSRQHHQQISRISEQQQDALTPYFQNLISKNDDEMDSLIIEIENYEREKVEITYQHFQEVKALLKSDQYEYYEDFVQRAIKIIISTPIKKGPPKKKF